MLVVVQEEEEEEEERLSYGEIAREKLRGDLEWRLCVCVRERD